MKWPRSKITQLLIALIFGLFAAASEEWKFAMNSFNNFYFGPHKAAPYPYPDMHTARVVEFRDCGLAFALAVIAAFELQRLITSRTPRGA
jgi:hypothetical protein